jgi:hypothetical protein
MAVTTKRARPPSGSTGAPRLPGSGRRRRADEEAAGDRVKTNRKEAELLVRLLMAGALTAVSVPPPAFEAARTA